MTRAHEIKRLHLEIYGELRTSLQKAIRIGELLTEQKEELRHGEWEDWVRENVNFSRATACNYMALYRKRETFKSLKLSGLAEAYQELYGPQKERKPKPPKEPADAVPAVREFSFELKDATEDKDLKSLLEWVGEKVFKTYNHKATVFAALNFAKEHGDA